MENQPYQPNQQQELNDCKEFAELLRSKYEPVENGDIVFTMTQLAEKFTESFIYTPEPESLKSAMQKAGYTFSLVPQDEDFRMGFVAKLK